MKSVLSSKGQLTIPIEIRKLFGLDTGVVVEFLTRKGDLILRKSIDDTKLQKWRGRGKIPGNISVDKYLDRVRGGNENSD